MYLDIIDHSDTPVLNTATVGVAMKNFQIITQGVDTIPLLFEIGADDNIWNQFPIRTLTANSPHTQADDILIRFNNPTLDIHELVDDNECYWYPAASLIPAQPYINALMSMVMGERIGRCVITRLKPGASITSHRDMGAPAKYYQRFHIAVQQGPGAVFKCGDEEFTPKVGDVFIFNNDLEHSVVNNSSSDRITMIVDIRTGLFEHIKQTRDFQTPKMVTTHIATHGTITYQTESFEDMVDELKPFSKIHWDELGLTKDDVQLDMDWDRFIKMEREGKLHTITVRDDGKLLGYHISFIGTHPHYKSTNHAVVDLYYLHKEHRLGRTGIRLFKYAEASLKKLGVVKISSGCKVKLDHTKLFEYLGYEFSDKMFIKIIA